MNKSNTLEIINTNIWIYLPNINTLSQYFNQKNLIELSKVCKNYRKQMKFKALRTLTVPRSFYKLDSTGPFNPKNKFKLIIDRLRSDLTGSHHLVKEVVYKLRFTKQFARDFFDLFPKISHITITSSNYSLNNLIEILSNSNHLQHITLIPNFAKFNPLMNNTSRNFFYQLKTIMIYFPPNIINQTLPCDVIDSSFSNLKSLTIINNRMMTKLSNGLPSLLYAKFSEKYEFEKTQLSIFISNNPQLKKITIFISILDDNVINSILTSEKLVQLEILGEIIPLETEFNVSTENYSIKHLNYIGNIYNEYIVGIIKLCKSLEIFEANDFNLTISLDDIINDKFPEIDTLLILRSPCILDISLVLNLKKFKQLKFRNGSKFEEVYKKYVYLWDSYWVAKHDYSKDTDEFTLIRK